MDRNSNYFYISGFISLSLFGLFLSLFIFMMLNKSEIESYALKKDNFISISLETPKLKSTKAPKKVAKSAVETINDTPSENIDIDDLFNDVWTKKIVHKQPKKKPINSKRLQEIQKKIKTSQVNDTKSISEKVVDLENNKNKDENQNSSTANAVNEYLAKIQALVYKYFRVPANSEGNSVKTVIELTALGKVIDFRVLTYSSNAALNEEVDKIKHRLKSVIFPINPQNKTSRTTVILISKE